MHRFEEIKCIGRGSYGSAHLVRSRQPDCLHERFVVKKIPMELLSAKEKDQSFREVELLAKLKHPNVVEYMENFVVDNVLHIVMAYCDGGDLAGKVKHQQKIREQIYAGPDDDISDPSGHFPISQVLDWFVQMAMAIKYLHGQRVLHRDLKTSNVFLTTENVVKLGDFGIAKTLDSTLDQAKTVVGTPYYMSPEVCESKPYSYASDVWSLGCVLYEMLALRHAFDAPNILTLILKIVQQDFAPVPPHYDAEVSDLLRKLLDKDPERRPSMEEIFAMPYIRRHMQGLVASGGSLKVKVINPVARRPQHGSASGVGRRRLHPKNLSARRSSGEKRRLRLATQAAVAPMQWMPIKYFGDEADDSDARNELELLDSSIVEEPQLSFRRPERSTTPEPLVFATEGKPHLNTLGNDEEDEVDEQLSGSVPSPIRPHPRRARDGQSVAWGLEVSAGRAQVNGTCSAINEDDDDDDSRFHAEAEELMNPNFQKDHWSNSTPRVQDVQDNGDVLELSTLSLDDDGSEGTRAPSLSESSMLRELELDADSDGGGASADTSSSEYEAEENFYSDDSSDFFDQSGTQYSDDFEDPDAEVIEYADEEFESTNDSQTFTPYRPAGDGGSPFARVPKLEGPTEVKWVMRNLAQSLMLTRDDLHP
ncbi:serine/threonine protein kinase [Phytophthora infestans T30-4]|uniref:non-specific serine/threonine protein kinase n=1 Tax=Phytophthora infestans (strain T30-4) TaxID=403677 RepID=D0P114_PHYIT|nr:serine/threonine protein kinase [Phytophthora infestans T30-4]EEY53726.1 serine/threonine protein kinase [Phytophthora infestans T30-4]|eukprot:XP_002896013.1 serine/threonine protein kinase [Phytophthora infestans T30-4]